MERDNLLEMGADARVGEIGKSWSMGIVAGRSCLHQIPFRLCPALKTCPCMQQMHGYPTKNEALTGPVDSAVLLR